MLHEGIRPLQHRSQRFLDLEKQSDDNAGAFQKIQNLPTTNDGVEYE
jgi:hypothetical protein